MPDEARLRVGTARAELGRIYDWLEGAAGASIPPAVRNAMHVALEELVMNIAMHGYGDETGEISLTFAASREEAVLEVADAGRPFDQSAAPIAPPDAAAPGGRGLKLLRHYCRHIDYALQDGRNRHVLHFPLR